MNWRCAVNQSKTSRKFRDYVSNIGFRFIKPHTPVPPFPFDRRIQRLKLGAVLEIFNTRLPHRDRNTRQRLRDLCFIPKMSTYAIGAMINEAVRQMSQDQVFVNIGVWHGFSLLAGMVDNEDKVCIGVDNFSEFGGPKEEFQERFDRYSSAKHRFYEAHYLDYFARQHDATIGFFIYDGSHNYQDQLRALQIAEPFFADDCLILIDDINYDEVDQATADFIASSDHDYDVILHKTTHGNHHPTFWNGVNIFRRVSANGRTSGKSYAAAQAMGT